MKKFFNKMSPEGSKTKGKPRTTKFGVRGREGQVKDGKRVFDKRSIVARRAWGLATRLQHVRNRGK